MCVNTVIILSWNINKHLSCQTAYSGQRLIKPAGHFCVRVRVCVCVRAGPALAIGRAGDRLGQGSSTKTA